MDVTFIIPTKDRSDILEQTINHLLEASIGFQVEILVINDSKTNNVYNPDDSKIKILQNTGNGVAAARNYGASIAKSTLLWFIDDDIWISREMIIHAFKLNSTFPQSAFNFNWIYPEYLINYIRSTPFGRFLEHIEFTTMKGWCKGTIWDSEKLFKTDFVAGATLLIPANSYNQINGYDDSFPLAGFEDYDFSVRLKNHGIISYIEPNVIARHNEVNKTNLSGFLQRTYNNAITRRHGVDIGYVDKKLNYTIFKRVVYSVINLFDPLIQIVLSKWPNSTKFDNVYFKTCHVLIGLYIYKGYNLKK